MSDHFQKGRYLQGFKDEIGNRESRGSGGYNAVSKSGRALGKYQKQEGALKDTGFMTSEGQWTGKYGVNSREDYLKNRQAQESGMDDFLKRTEKSLKTYKVNREIGRIVGGRMGNYNITKSGMLAAAHRRGARAVKEYTDHLRENNWQSNLDAILDEKQRRKFMHIETRMREFQKIKALNE